jgi:hypothetical protein
MWRHYLNTAINTVSNALKTVSTGVIVAPEAIKWKQIAQEFKNSNIIQLGPGDANDVATRAQNYPSTVYKQGRHVYAF